MRTRLFLCCAIFLMTSGISAAPGDLDPTFGNGGKFISWPGLARAVATQPDGKIVVAGDNYIPPGSNSDFVLARYNSDGSADTSFGIGGRAAEPRLPGYDTASSVTIQPNGKIIVGVALNSSQWTLVLIRFNSNGSLDTSFGSGGIVSTPGLWGVRSVVLQADGKILAATFDLGTFRFAVARYTSGGSLDTSFGGTGIVTTIPSGFFNNALASSLAIQTDGKIIAAGCICEWDDNYRHFALVRHKPDGSLDETFGNNGIVITDGENAYGGADSVVIQADGKIVAGSAYGVIIRYRSNGSLDSEFGSGGIVSDVTGASVALQPDGKILTSGVRWNGQDVDFSIARLRMDGSLDTTFGGGDGIGIVDFEERSDESLGMALDNRGRAVLVGMSNDPQGTNRFGALARILLTSSAQYDFDGDGRSDISVFRPSNSVWYLDRSAQGFSATQFGLADDKIVPADYDGDGKTDIAVFRDGTWWRIDSSSSTIAALTFGTSDDIPVPADYTGDGRDEIAIYRNGQWWSFDLSNGQTSVVKFGLATDKPVAADYDGDGRVDQAIYRNGEWHVNNSSLGYRVARFGLSTDRPVVEDYDGDGHADLAVYRDGTWYLQRSTAGFGAFQWGIATDSLAPADYDGDGKADAAVFRDGIWYLNRTSGGALTQQFGLQGDAPVAAAYLP